MRSPDSRTLGNAPPARHEPGQAERRACRKNDGPAEQRLGVGVVGGWFMLQELGRGGLSGGGGRGGKQVGRGEDLRKAGDS